MNAEVRQQEKLNRAEERYFRRGIITRKIYSKDEVLSTKCLSYIHLANSLYYTKPSLP